MKVSEQVDAIAEGLVQLAPRKKTRLAVTIAAAALTAGRMPFVASLVTAMLAGYAAEQIHEVLGDMHELSVKQIAYLDALQAKAVSDAPGGV